MDFMAKKTINENYNIKNVTYAQSIISDDEDFNF